MTGPEFAIRPAIMKKFIDDENWDPKHFPMMIVHEAVARCTESGGDLEATFQTVLAELQHEAAVWLPQLHGFTEPGMN